MLVWVRDNADELKDLKRSIGNTDYLIIGRTEKAFLSHPKTWQETELVTNHMFEIYYGKEADITAGSCIVSRRCAKVLSQFSKASVTDGEWPSLLLRRNYYIDCIYVDGLKYIDEFNGVTNPQKQSKELMDRLNLSRKICESIYDIYYVYKAKDGKYYVERRYEGIYEIRDQYYNELIKY